MIQRNSLVTFAVLAGLVIGIVGLSRTGALRGFNALLARATAPISSFFYRFTNYARPEATDGLSAPELASRLEASEKEKRELLAENGRLTHVEQENAELRAYLNFFKTSDRSYQLADIVSRGRSGDSWQIPQTILLNRGAKDGLKLGAPLVDAEGILLGKVISLSDTTAEACLLFSSECRIAVGVQGKPGTLGILQSDLNLTLKIDFISQGEVAQDGQLIVTSGLEDGMPGGLVIGRINQVIRQSNELWQHAIIDPAADFDNLKTVAVIK